MSEEQEQEQGQEQEQEQEVTSEEVGSVYDILGGDEAEEEEEEQETEETEEASADEQQDSELDPSSDTEGMGTSSESEEAEADDTTNDTPPPAPPVRRQRDLPEEMRNTQNVLSLGNRVRVANAQTTMSTRKAMAQAAWLCWAARRNTDFDEREADEIFESIMGVTE